MSSSVTYVDVILPLALPKAYTYAVPVELVDFIKKGQRVIVQFGRNRYYSAIVKNIHHQKPPLATKLIEGIAEEEPIVTETQLQFWEWMSRYYLCTEGEVMNAALPAGLKLSSETVIRFNESYEGNYDSLSEEEFVVVQALRAHNDLKIPQIQDLLKKRNIYPILKTLFHLGIAISAEEITDRYKPRTESYIKLHEKYHDPIALEQLYAELNRAPKQVELLLALVQLQHRTKFIRKKDLLNLSQSTPAVLAALVKRGVFVLFTVEVSRLGNLQTEELVEMPLSAEQEIALQQIREQWQTHHTVLLHGVTGSGKTNIYIEKIKEVVAGGKQVLYLLPEIALTAQIINRLRKVFGNRVGIYHSKFDQNERVEIWTKILRGDYTIVIGARSALFLPFTHLGLIVVDEEHDPSLKQIAPAPRYHARDAAIMLAQYHEAEVLLGTATPAIETYFNCRQGKFGLVTLTHRYGNIELPDLLVANVKEETKWKRMQGSFTPELVRLLQETLKEKEQAILFINRRGFAHYQECKTCGYVYQCKNCDVSLTYHKFRNELVCHYCGYHEKMHHVCKNCGAVDLTIVGSGTEKIEDEIAELLPTARVSRLDYDTARTKNGHSEVIAQFENRETDILVGTQMVSKGLDFDHVHIVGIMNADQLLHYADFRAQERAFQLMTQVAGRAGRKNKKGVVVIQTSDPQHPVISDVLHYDYLSLYERELLHRRQFRYPPFTRMVELNLQHKEIDCVERAALYIAGEMRKANKGTVLGPAIPFISKVKNNYIRELLLKSEKQSRQLNEMKQCLAEVVSKMKSIAELKAVQVNIQVDP